MFDYQKFQELFQTNLVEADKYIDQAISQGVKSPLLKLAEVMIDLTLHHKKSYAECYKIVHSLLFKIPQDHLGQAMYYLLLLATDCGYYNKTIRIANEFLKRGIEEPFVFACLARAYVNTKGKEKDAEIAIEKVLGRGINAGDECLNTAIDARIQLYVKNNDYNGAREFINRLYFLSLPNDFLLYHELTTELKFKPINIERITSIIDNQTKDDLKVSALLEVLDYLLNNEIYDQIDLFLDKLKPFADKDLSVYLSYVTRSAFYLVFIKKNAQEYLDLVGKLDAETLSQQPFIMFYAGQAYRRFNTYESNLIAIEWFKKVISANPIDSYINLGQIAQKIGNLELLKEASDELIKNREPFGFDLAIEYYAKGKGDFDTASKLIKKYKRFNPFNMYLYNKFRYSAKGLVNSVISSKKNYFCYRQLAASYLNGYLNRKRNIKKALLFATKAYEMNNNDNCVLSMLGHVYYVQEEYEKAFELFKKGYERYVEEESSCSCCLPFYVLSLYEGKGVAKDEDTAYQILKDNVKHFAYEQSENALNLFAYLSIMRNENLELAFELLQNHHEYRYEVGKYYYLVWLAKLLKKDASKYESILKKNLKKASKMERNHYKKPNQNVFMTNI